MDPALWKQKVETLEKLLGNNFTLPHQKRVNLLKSPTSKLQWLHKNLPKENSNHSNFQEAYKLLTDLVG